MPTTVNLGRTPDGGYDRQGHFDSWLYMDDFAMAGSEEALPKYTE